LSPLIPITILSAIDRGQCRLDPQGCQNLQECLTDGPIKVTVADDCANLPARRGGPPVTVAGGEAAAGRPATASKSLATAAADKPKRAVSSAAESG
jgi:hypothetical protein